MALKVRMRMLMRRFHLPHPRMSIPMQIYNLCELFSDADANTRFIFDTFHIKILNDSILDMPR